MVYKEMVNTIDVSCADIDRKMGSIKGGGERFQTMSG